MRMDEMGDGRYIKETDTIERYLLKLIQDYFNSTSVADESSREAVINKAVQRMHEELTLDTAGVLSVELPDGVKRTGAVNISLGELGGEPAITEKKTAFNVNFGDTNNTACEGNDPRLYDRREPEAHGHEVSDIAGLEGELSTLKGKLERLGGIEHEHSNKDILDMITYTGELKEIDLGILNGAENNVKEIAEKTEQDIGVYKTETNEQVSGITDTLDSNNTAIQGLRDTVTETNATCLAEAKEYTDSVFSSASTAIMDDMDIVYVRRDSVGALADVARNAMVFAGSFEIPISSVIDRTETARVQSSETDIPAEVLEVLAERSVTADECQLETMVKYYDTSGNAVYAQMPYIVFRNNVIDSTLQCGIIHGTNKMRVSYVSTSGIFPASFEGSIIVNMYSKNNTSL